MKAFVRDNALGLAFGAAFLLTLVGQSVAGLADFNNQQVADGTDPVGYLPYVMSSSFAVDVAENWQSEYLQFILYVFGTVWLFQRGSPESKPLHQLGRESDRDQQTGRHVTEGSPAWAKAGGWRTAIFSRSLGLLMGVIFLLCWFAQAVAGWAAYNSEQLGQREDTIEWLSYLGSADFWNRSLQNWQSELLAVGSFAVLSVFLASAAPRNPNPSARSTAPPQRAADQLPTVARPRPVSRRCSALRRCPQVESSAYSPRAPRVGIAGCPRIDSGVCTSSRGD